LNKIPMTISCFNGRLWSEAHSPTWRSSLMTTCSMRTPFPFKKVSTPLMMSRRVMVNLALDLKTKTMVMISKPADTPCHIRKERLLITDP